MKKHSFHSNKSKQETYIPDSFEIRSDVFLNGVCKYLVWNFCYENFAIMHPLSALWNSEEAVVGDDKL